MGFCGLLLAPSPTSAYSGFIGLGYSSCGTCHYNSFGNGPLTDYGRALAATEISAKPFFLPNAADEQLGEWSGVIGKTPLPDYVRIAGNYRGLFYKSGIQSDNSHQRWITMVARIAAVVQSEDRKLYATGEIGYAPTPQRTSRSARAGNMISREHYVGWQFAKEWKLQAGFQDIVYGLRIPDHEAFSRSRTLLSQNDQTHGAAIHYASEPFEAGLHVFGGNLYQDSDLQFRGGSAMFEYSAGEKIRVGASAMGGFNKFRTRFLGAAHARVGMGEGSSLLAETGFIRETAKQNVSSFGGYTFLQNALRVVRGFNILGTAQHYTQSWTKSQAHIFSVGPGIQYFPFQRLELRSDFMVTRTHGTDALSQDSLDWTAQVHLWF